MRAGYYVYVSPNGKTFTTIADAPKHGKDDEQKGDGEEAASPAAGSSPLQSLKNYDQPDAAGAAGVKPGAQLKYPHLLEITLGQRVKVLQSFELLGMPESDHDICPSMLLFFLINLF